MLTADLIVKLGNLCGLTKRQRNAIEDALGEAMLSVDSNMREAASHSPHFQPAAERMQQLWSHGARVFDIECADGLLEVCEVVDRPAPFVAKVE